MEQRKLYTGWENPQRQLVLWGKNKSGDPAFLILLGTQEFESKIEENQNRRNYYAEIMDKGYLEDEVTYTHYILKEGKNGHFPSFSFKTSGPYIKNKYEYFTAINRKKDTEKIEELKEEIILPYYGEFDYTYIVKEIKKSGNKIENFEFSDNPAEFFDFLEEKDKYIMPEICEMTAYPNLYIRKKRLNELINKNLEPEIYVKIFNQASNELMSGMFLEFAKTRNSCLKEEAEKIINEDELLSSYEKGLKRCAVIYLNAITEEKRQEREKWIKENISSMNPKLIRDNCGTFKEGKELNGSEYKRLKNGYFYCYEAGGYGSFFSDIAHKWRNGKRIEVKKPFNIYNKNFYNNGFNFNMEALKNTIQEIECYDMPEELGKTAYIFDAPPLYAYCYSIHTDYYNDYYTDRNKYRYFKRYIRRIIDNYAESSPDKFMTVMKILLTSYTDKDFINGFKGNFENNFYIMHYLYHDYINNKPDNWIPVNKRIHKDDKCLELKGRYEYKKELWQEKPDDVFYIMTHAKIPSVIKAMFYILKDREDFRERMNSLKSEDLLRIIEAQKENEVSSYLKDILTERINNKTEFNINLLKVLLNSKNEFWENGGINYFNFFAENKLIDLKSSQVIEFILNSGNSVMEKIAFSALKNIPAENYSDFITEFIKNKEINQIKISDNIREELLNCSHKIKDFSKEDKEKILYSAVKYINGNNKFSGLKADIIEKLLLNFEEEDLKILVKAYDLKSIRANARGRRLLNIISSQSMGIIPKDRETADILENGNSDYLRILINLILKNREELKKRHKTMLMLLEKDIEVLNREINEIFYELEEGERIKFHKLILDSPEEKVSDYALLKIKEIYGDYVPEDFIKCMLEHSSVRVKAYITDKSEQILKHIKKEDRDLFIYYAETLLFLPNRVRKNKDDIYEALYKFALIDKENYEDVKEILLLMGSSNIKKDSEKALVTLAKLNGEVQINEN